MKLPEIRRPSKNTLRKIHSIKSKRGELAVIEPETGDFYTGKDLLEAVKKARKHHPESIFYTICNNISLDLINDKLTLSS